jgi:2-dehydropantoate 2-reductase
VLESIAIIIGVRIVIRAIPHINAGDTPFDYIVCTTKNVPDIPPELCIQIAPAVTPGHTIIVLIQNGLNIEKAVFRQFPKNIVLSGVSMIGSQEVTAGVIEHDFPDKLIVGAFRNSNLDPAKEDAAAKRFVGIYAAGGKTECEFTDNVGFSRWRKLIYNACLNPICAITGLDTGRIRLADEAIEMLVRPAMEEIRAAAKAAGHDLPEDICDTMIEVDPLRMYLPPSMLADVRKVSYEIYIKDQVKQNVNELGKLY